MRLEHVRYLVLHLDRLRPDDVRIKMAEKLFTTAPVYRSDKLIVYDTGGGTPPSSLFGAVEDTDDWGGVEQGKSRWASSNYARIYVWSGAEREVTLRFSLRSFAQTRQVSISAGGAILAAGSVDTGGRTFYLSWQVQRGLNTVLMSISGPLVSPASLGVGEDERPLSVNLSGCIYSTK
jgi:hypothetical protein